MPDTLHVYSYLILIQNKQMKKKKKHEVRHPNFKSKELGDFQLKVMAE